MKAILTSLLVVAAVVGFAADEAVLRERQKGKLFPVLDRELLHQFEMSTFEAFTSHPMREELKVGYALALSGFWLDDDLKTSESYNNLALELARKYHLKNEEAQAVMGSALLACASKDTSVALERIAKAISLFKEAGSKNVICDAMFYQAGLQRKCGMKAECIKTLTEIQLLAEGPQKDSIKDACRSEIAKIEAELTATNAPKTNDQPDGAANGASPRR